MNAETRKLLGIPPMPVNNNHRRDDARMEKVITVPVCGIAALYAFGVVCGICGTVIVQFFLP